MSAGVCAEMGQMMKRRLLIFGCSGHGKVIWDLAWKMKRYEEICFLDDNPQGRSVMGAPLIGGRDFADFKAADELIVAIGNGGIRGKLQKYFADKGMKIATLVHPNSTIGSHVTLGRGTVVMAGAVINSETQIGEGLRSSIRLHRWIMTVYWEISVMWPWEPMWPEGFMWEISPGSAPGLW